ncbi:MAG TPA: hypothetical protein VMJ34_23995 [Bryobacteraceae bacterium]|nr:hypothetical protein [Bryobacteraceae bacterium]
MTPQVAVMFMAFLILVVVVMVGFTMAARFKHRELAHRERMAAIEKGVAVPGLGEGAGQNASLPPRTLLLRGLVWMFSGIAAVVALAGISALDTYQDPAWVRVDHANAARAAGASNAEIQQIMNDRHSGGPNPGIALLGFVPIGVGAAYLITWRAAKKEPA